MSALLVDSGRAALCRKRVIIDPIVFIRPRLESERDHSARKESQLTGAYDKLAFMLGRMIGIDTII